MRPRLLLRSREFTTVSHLATRCRNFLERARIYFSALSNAPSLQPVGRTFQLEQRLDMKKRSKEQDEWYCSLCVVVEVVV